MDMKFPVLRGGALVKLKVLFSSDFEGQTYTINGASETYTGTVPNTLIVEQEVQSLDTDYTVTCDDDLEVTYSTSVYVGEYYGIYKVELSSFSAILKVTTDVGATVVATTEGRTYRGTAGDDKTVKLNIGKAGTYSVTASLDGETTSPVSVVISEQIQYTASCPVFPLVSWSTGTDAEISQMIRLAHRGLIDLQTDAGWSVGDVRTITVQQFTMYGTTTCPNQDINIVISSFDDYESCGCVMQFDFKNCLSVGCGINATNTNAGGYASSRMYNTTLPALVLALPSWLQDLLITFDCKASAGNRSTTIETIINNKLALRSEIEVFGTRTYSAEGEGAQIHYYTEDANKVKTQGINGNAFKWFERSPAASSNQWWCRVSGEATAEDSNADNTHGIAPFGCI